jgi:hypothetical protein
LSGNAALFPGIERTAELKQPEILLESFKKVVNRQFLPK